jgi:hypothetical protein
MIEQITVLEFRHNWFPARFCWRGREYSIEGVNECKTEQTQHHFWVRCEGVIIHLIHRVQADQWTVHRPQEECHGARAIMV